jgi:hypothetical protein
MINKHLLYVVIDETKPSYILPTGSTDRRRIMKSIEKIGRVVAENRRNLRAAATDASRNPRADGHGEVRELLRLEEFENLLELLDEQHLLLAVGHGPAAENPSDHGVREVRLLVHELEHAVRELAVVGVHPPCPVQRQQHARQERAVLRLERHREAADDAAADLEQLGDAAAAALLLLGGARRLVDEPQERDGHGPAHEGALAGELGVELVVRRLEPVALARVLRREQREEAGEEGAAHVVAQRPGVGGRDEGEEDVVHDLKVRPRRGQHRHRRILVDAVGRERRVCGRRQCPEQVGADHLHERHHHPVVSRLLLGPDRGEHLHEPLRLGVPLLDTLGVVGEREHAVARGDLGDEAVGLGLRRGRRELGRPREKAVRLLELEQEPQRGRLPRPWQHLRAHGC